jgi:dihydroxy-acid dehydratase
MGIKEQDFNRPKIAVVNSSSGLSVCYSHLDAIAKQIVDEIYKAGGLGFEIRTVAPSDFVTSAGREARYLMPSRDLIVNDIEAAVEGAVLDGMVLLSSCDKTTPGHLMAAARLNVPSVVVVCGYQVAGCLKDAQVDIDTVYEEVGAVAVGKMSTQELAEIANVAIVGPGVCAGLGTANSMHMVAEALGMTLPGSAPVRADSAKMKENALRSAHAVLDLLARNIKPRDIITADAIKNALTLAVAVGTSVNVIRHITAISVEAGLNLDVIAMLESLGGNVPLLAQIRPNGSATVPQLEAAGGAHAALGELKDYLELDVLTVAGLTFKQVLAEAKSQNRSVLTTATEPISMVGGLRVLRGSLAPDGAILKTAAVSDVNRKFIGKAKVFVDEASALSAVRSGEVVAGDVLVLRGMGPRGGPGTVFAAGLVAALVGAELSNQVAVVTDGELSGLNSGLTVGQVMPEAADGGPLAIVQDGDEIVIDLPNWRLDLNISENELLSRLSNLEKRPKWQEVTGLLRLYGANVGPLNRGAVLGDALSNQITKEKRGGQR